MTSARRTVIMLVAQLVLVGAPGIASVATLAADRAGHDPLRPAKPLPATPGAAIPGPAAAACTPRPRLYDTDKDAYRNQARAIFRQYHIPYAKHRNYELDHLIPRCIGGADIAPNLWPQPLAEALRKNEVEREICRQVCDAHTMTLEHGQAIFTQGHW